MFQPPEDLVPVPPGLAPHLLPRHSQLVCDPFVLDYEGASSGVLEKRLFLDLHSASASSDSLGGAPELAPMRVDPSTSLSDMRRPTNRAAALAQEVMADGLTTLQCHGLANESTVEQLVWALNAVGLGGCYNFVSIPRQVTESSLDCEGYAFINFTSSESAALVVQLWEGLPRGHLDLFAKQVRIKPAAKQGYHEHASDRKLRKYKRIRKRAVWPLVMTEDGTDAVFGTEEAIAAAFAHRMPMRINLSM
mmetsp:Transcript_10494/g.18987  ORF Transcript_10494/g.18987 Transcript_10494/m.18987 type:complete len:249 (-) Transcript_10494:114-860(-)